MRNMKKLLALVLTLLLLMGTVTLPVSAAGDAMNVSDLKTLVNSEKLHPQPTGYAEVDAILEEIFAPYANSDNYTKLKAAYDWTVRKINYSWGPYSQNWAPAYDCFVPRYALSYNHDLEPVMPYEVVNRTYHALAYREGICYDYGAVLAVMARYLGFDAFVHTGDFKFEPGYGTGSGHHGWTEIVLGGKNYIFDPQRDYRMSANGTGTIPYNYFGISYANAWRYTQETSVNAKRDAQFRSVTVPRRVYIGLESLAESTLTGHGYYEIGTSATVDVSGTRAFIGWYDKDGLLLSRESEYRFVVTGPTKLRAVFDDRYFNDLRDDLWYATDANEAFERGFVNGTAPFYFDAYTTMSRAMALTMLYRLVQPEGDAPEAGYVDVPKGAWFEQAVNWGTQEGIVEGVGEGRFAPNDPVTREQFVTMMMRLFGSENFAELEYSDADQISEFALEAMLQAQAEGLLKGYVDNTVRPLSQLTRCEGVAFLMRLARLMVQ